MLRKSGRSMIRQCKATARIVGIPRQEHLVRSCKSEIRLVASFQQARGDVAGRNFAV